MSKDLRVVKSAKRVLEVLEYLDQAQRKVTVLDVARALEYPQSSASELLRSLYTLGYLNYDRQLRVYWPAARVALLGSWVHPELFRCGRLLPMMDAVHRATGRLTALGASVGLGVQYIHVLGDDDDVAPEHGVSRGTNVSLTRSAMGLLFLSLQSGIKLRQMILRLNADEADADRRISLKTLEERLSTIRRDGYAFLPHECGKDAGMVAILLPRAEDCEPLALGMRYPADTRETPAQAADYLRRHLDGHPVQPCETAQTWARPQTPSYSQPEGPCAIPLANAEGSARQSRNLHLVDQVTN